MRIKPGGDRMKIGLEKRHVRRGGYGMEMKDVISIESEMIII